MLFRKLRCYGLNGRALKWFISYFSQRKQIANMLDVFSPAILNDIGIAQCCCLGTIMFIICMNDIVRCTNEIKFLIYADDTTPYVSGVDSAQCISIMNQRLSHLYR